MTGIIMTAAFLVLLLAVLSGSLVNIMVGTGLFVQAFAFMATAGEMRLILVWVGVVLIVGATVLHYKRNPNATERR